MWKGDIEDEYFIKGLFGKVCVVSIEVVGEGDEWFVYYYVFDIKVIKEEEVFDEVLKKLLERVECEDIRRGRIMKLVEVFGIDVNKVVLFF